MEKLEEELSLDPPCPQTPAHTHTRVHSCLPFLWLWESVRHKCGLGAAVMEVKTAALSELIQKRKTKKKEKEADTGL